MFKLIILDRDGIINYDSPNYIRSPDDWKPIASSIEAIANLTAAGFKIAVVTNQSGIARGLYTLDKLEAIHQKMLQTCQQAGGNIDAIYYCPHHPDEGCHCRKPKTGMLDKIAEDFGCNLQDIPFVGDRYTDLQAARTVGAKPILIKSAMTVITDEMDLSDVEQFVDLTSFVATLLTKP